MTGTLPFGEVLEAADLLTPDEQETLIVILRRRLAQSGRQRLLADIEESEKEFAEGRCKIVTPEELMREILA